MMELVLEIAPFAIGFAIGWLAWGIQEHRKAQQHENIRLERRARREALSDIRPPPEDQ